MILESVALHHQPVQLEEESSLVLAVVHAGNVFASRDHPSASGPAMATLDQLFLNAVGLGERSLVWEAADREESAARAA